MLVVTCIIRTGRDYSHISCMGIHKYSYMGDCVWESVYGRLYMGGLSMGDLYGIRPAWIWLELGLGLGLGLASALVFVLHGYEGQIRCTNPYGTSR